jgi:predicted ABC-type transport system involved in lysophospholipase L1 biosynthesis ATPase subunit
VNADRVFELLLALQRDLGATLVLVTHDAGLAGRMKLHFTLERGRLAASAS